MRLLCTWIIGFLGLLTFSGSRAEPVPAEFREALKSYQSEGTRGWAFTQSTQGAGQSLVERFDPRLTEFHRWTLVEKDGRAPTPAETKTYNEQQTRRTRGETAPNVKDQIDEPTAERVSDDGTRATWRFRLKATDKDDRSAAHMTAAFTLHRPTSTIERMELSSFESFKPVMGIHIDEARTVIEYSLPEGERPTLLRTITVRLRGRAWWFKSLDQDLSVDYTGFEPARKKRDRSGD